MRQALFLIIFLIIVGCGTGTEAPSEEAYSQITGKTMGTITYRVVYSNPNKQNFKVSIDSLLSAFNNEVSTYVPTSAISRFNSNTIDFSEGANNLNDYPHFKTNIEAALAIAEKTSGAFDPTVMPLINYWGFGSAGKRQVALIDSLKVDSFLNFIGFQKLTYIPSDTISSLQKSDDRLGVDLGGLAKGYALDILADFLDSKEIENYLIEIGLEVRAKGKNPKGAIWKIGINTPKPDAQLTDIEEIVALDNRSIATSGNYRQFYEVDGQKLGHIINPTTGFPDNSNLLSVSVFAPSCMVADGYATAFMVMGLEQAKQFVEDDPELDALFIVGQPDGSLEVKKTF